MPEADRITFIGHSMGGILARYFLESPTHNGWRVLRRLITIGTPHLGLPEAFLHLIGRTFPFPENPFYRGARDAILQQMSQAGSGHPQESGPVSPRPDPDRCPHIHGLRVRAHASL